MPKMIFDKEKRTKSRFFGGKKKNTQRRNTQKERTLIMLATAAELQDIKQDDLARTISVLESLVKRSTPDIFDTSRSKIWKRLHSSILALAHNQEGVVTRQQRKRLRRQERSLRRKRVITQHYQHEYAKQQKSRQQSLEGNKGNEEENRKETANDETEKKNNEGNKVEEPHIRCYVCKTKFAVSQHHAFYLSMCNACGAENKIKREQWQKVNLSGKIAIVTGARLKIGFETALMLLRTGCTVVATTRFVANAQLRYQKVHDYNLWKNRLILVRLELQSHTAVQRFCDWVGARFEHVDIFVNNAAQTIWRPAQFYQQEIQQEIQQIQQENQQENQQEIQHQQRQIQQEKNQQENQQQDIQQEKNQQENQQIQQEIQEAMPQKIQEKIEIFLCGSGALDKWEDKTAEEDFPLGKMDRHGQQLDLRSSNSWCQNRHTTSVVELMQDFVIACAAPFLMIQRLSKVMKKEEGNRDPSWIVMVSAVEAMFNIPHKSARHPASNCAKAAQNMITRTSAPELRALGIEIYSADTGYVTVEFPHGHPQHEHAPPLDEIDGAARVLDPIFTAALGGPILSGKLFKDFRETTW